MTGEHGLEYAVAGMGYPAPKFPDHAVLLGRQVEIAGLVLAEAQVDPHGGGQQPAQGDGLGTWTRVTSWIVAGDPGRNDATGAANTRP